MSAPTVQQTVENDKRFDSKRAQKNKQSPWTLHLRSLLGREVTVSVQGPTSLLEFSGRLIAIAFDHMNCAIECEGKILTFKSVHHIASGLGRDKPEDVL